jgi:hypothetical protein
MDAYYYKQTLRSYYTGPGLIRTNSNNNGYSSSMLYAGQPLIKQSSSSSSPTKTSSSKSSYSPWNSSTSSYSSNNNNSSSTWGNGANQSYSFGSKKDEVKQENKKNESGSATKSINFESNIGVFNRQRDLEIRISFG